MEAKVNYGWIEKDELGDVRRFEPLKLEIEKIAMFPTSWTIVHPINEDSPLWNKTPADIQKIESELYIMIKGFDETFSQVIFSRHSYMHYDFLWGATFKRPFYVNAKGKLVMDIDKVGDYELTAAK